MVIDMLIVLGVVYLFIGVLHAVRHILEEIYDKEGYRNTWEKIVVVLIVGVIAFIAYPILWGTRYINIKDGNGK